MTQTKPPPENPGRFKVEVCDYCGGTGIMGANESDGEGHIMQGVGERKCICQIN